MFKTRILIFSLLFILISGIIGSWLVPTSLLYSNGFYIYGNLGKLVIIAIIIFGFLLKSKQRIIHSLPTPKYNWSLMVMTIPLTIIFFLIANKLLLNNDLGLTIITHAWLISIPLAMLIGTFGHKFLIAFVKTFYKELSLGVVVALLYDLAIFQVWKLWPLFSGTVLKVVEFFARLTTNNVTLVRPRTLYVNGFGVEIGEACSGLDSLFMFLSMSVLIMVIEWRRLDHKKLSLMILPGLVGLYFVNILRVFALVMIGAFISPAIATKLFHTYLGMVLFIGYFFLFWKITYKNVTKSL